MHLVSIKRSGHPRPLINFLIASILCRRDRVRVASAPEVQHQICLMHSFTCSLEAGRGVDDGQHDNWRLDGAASETARFSDQMVIDEKLG